AYDFFDPLSHTDNSQLSNEQRQNRLLLKALMEKHGFVNYDKEWWHFTLKDEPYKNRYFAFPVDTIATVAFRRSYFSHPITENYTSPVIQLESLMDRAV